MHQDFQVAIKKSFYFYFRHDIFIPFSHKKGDVY